MWEREFTWILFAYLAQCMYPSNLLIKLLLHLGDCFERRFLSVCKSRIDEALDQIGSFVQ